MIFFSIFWTTYIPLTMLLITLVSALKTHRRDMRAIQKLARPANRRRLGLGR
jgi:hypothetical protein